MIRYEEKVYLLEFVDEDGDRMSALNTAAMDGRTDMEIKAVSREAVQSLAVWVGEALTGQIATTRIGETVTQIRVFDIRASPFEHQREFVRIATSLAFKATALAPRAIGAKECYTSVNF